MTKTNTSIGFYAVANSLHYLGLVAMINSLRLVGHDEPIYVGDCGLEESQRRRLTGHATLVDADGMTAPHLAKTVAPLAQPSDTMVLIDADVIVTRSLAPLLDRAREGKTVAFCDKVAHRFDERWSELLGLGALRRQPYVNTGLVAFGQGLGRELLEDVAAGSAQVEIQHTCMANGSPDYAFYYLEQDVLNAVLANRPAAELEVLDHRLAPFPPFPGVRIVDEATLRCAYEDGEQPFALHHVARKPWLAATRWSVYSQLLVRLLSEPDVAVRIHRDELPFRLQTGKLSWLERHRNNALATLAANRGKLGFRRKLALRTKDS